MANDEQLDIRELHDGAWQLTFPYNADFIAFLKSTVPARDRKYDPDTNIWTLLNADKLSNVESVGLQKFSYVTKIFYRDKKQVWKNLRSGVETTQENLF